ncbi:MAG TPA: hypothetical protein ENN41_09400, partial [Sediminispirochaeta sp.]|nr:hypothetical protein [Sediminispirochaeta sp.]
MEKVIHRTSTVFLFSTILFIVSLPQLFAYPLYMPDDREVSELVAIYNRAGYVFPPASFPLSTADIHELAGRLIDNISGDESDQSRQLLPMLREYRRALNYAPNRVVQGHEYSLKGAALFSDDSPPVEAGGEDPVAHYRFPFDFYHRFVEFPDMAKLALWAGKTGSSGMHISAGIKREYLHNTSPESNLFAYTEDDPFKIENYFLRSGYLAWRGGGFEGWFGRAPVHYGDADFNSFLPSARLPWLDAFTYRYSLGPLTMTSYFATLENRQVTNGPGGTAEVLPTIDERPEPEVYDFGRTIIFNSMHRFIFSWDRFRFGVTSAHVAARENNALHLGDLFPVFSWHNAVVGHHNMHIVLDAAYAPFRGMSIYGQAGWDDINAADLFGIPDSGVPTIGAYLLGLSYR